jgi:hypothetical protein
MNILNAKKNALTSIALSCVLFSCAPKKKVATIDVEPPKIQMPKVEAPSGNLVPFTRELFFKLRDNGLDMKRLKFYVDRTIVLNKVASNDNMEIDADGKLVKKTGLAENTISITPLVAGMIENVEADGVRLNFGRPNSTLKFINNNLSPKFFVFAADKIDKINNNNEVTYNNSTYKATSDGGGGIGEIKLMIKQLDIEIGNGKGTVEPGVGSRTSLNGF